MVKVIRYGDTIIVDNPAMPGEKTTMILVTFEERGRGGANHSVSDTSDVLSEAIGEDIGLSSVRIHTQPIRIEKIGLFPIGKELNLYINRRITSTPQIRQQEGRPPRMVDGKPSYFQTTLDKTPKADEDLRLSNDVLARTNPELFYSAVVGAARTERMATEQITAEEELARGTEELGS